MNQTPSLENPLVLKKPPREPSSRPCYIEPCTLWPNLRLHLRLLLQSQHLFRHHNHHKHATALISSLFPQHICYNETRHNWLFCTIQQFQLNSTQGFWRDLTQVFLTQFNPRFVTGFDSVFLTRFESQFSTGFDSHFFQFNLTHISCNCFWFESHHLSSIPVRLHGVPLWSGCLWNNPTLKSWNITLLCETGVFLARTF